MQTDYKPEYLEAAKRAETILRLEDEGFRVTRRPRGKHGEFDLIARKGGKTVAIEFVAQSKLRMEHERVKRLRAHARELGIHEFRLEVVFPPRRYHIEVENLEEEFEDRLMNDIPQELHSLGDPYIESVSDLEVDWIEVGTTSMRIKGTLSIDAEVRIGGSRDGVQIPMSCPTTFDVELDRDLRISSVHLLKCDVSSWSE